MCSSAEILKFRLNNYYASSVHWPRIQIIRWSAWIGFRRFGLQNWVYGVPAGLEVPEWLWNYNFPHGPAGKLRIVAQTKGPSSGNTFYDLINDRMIEWKLINISVCMQKNSKFQSNFLPHFSRQAKRGGIYEIPGKPYLLVAS